MSAISTSSKVLLTGGSGFLGAWILKELLERGFKVRAAVRNESKAEYLRILFKDHSENLEFAIVKDITTPGAFDEAVKGVDAIIHSASPISGGAEDAEPKVFIEPAVLGTTGILKSAQGSSSVTRVVITSSVLSQLDLSKSFPAVFTEDDWNEPAIKIVEENGKNAPSFIKYSASKTLAERAAWKEIKDNNPQFDLVAVMPAYIWGQVISETTANLSGSNMILLSPLRKSEQENADKEKLLKEWQFVDVRDSAKFHVDALLSPEAGGQRISTSAQTITTQHIYDILNANPIEGFEVIRGEPDLLKGWSPNVAFSNNKSKEILGAKYRSVEDTVRNTVVHALALGWKQ